jgi:hypothetical protein
MPSVRPTNNSNGTRKGRPRKSEKRIKLDMANANGNTTISFDEPDAAKRSKRPWYEIHTDAAAYVDAVLDAFVKTFGDKEEGFARKVGNLNVPLDRDSEHPNNRAVRLLNDRCDKRKLPCYAAIRNTNVHLVIGKRKVIKRAKRTGKPETANA